MTGWRTKLAIAFLALLFLVAAILVALMPDSGRPMVSTTLGDGRVLQVRLVTLGTNHAFRTEPRWKGTLLKILPRQLSGAMGLKPGVTFKRTTREPTLVAWIHTTSTKGLKPDKYRPEFSNIKVTADNGEQFDCHRWPAPETMEDSVMLPLIVSIYPRRDRSFTVTGAMDGHDFSLRIHNPDPFRDKVSGLPSDIPVTNALGDVDVILRSGTYTTFEWGHGPQMEFEFWNQGSNITDQFDKWWLVSDVTGNQGWRVPTNEPLWMIDVSYYRTKPIKWPRHRYYTFTTTNALAPTTHVTREPNVQVMDTMIRKVWMGGPGTVIWHDGEIVSVEEPPADGKTQPYHGTHTKNGKQQLKWGRGEPWVMVDTSRFDNSRHFLSVFLIDSRGQAAVVERHTKINWAKLHATAFWLPRDRNQDLKLVPPLTVQVVVQDLGKAKFVIDPASLPRGVASKETD